MYFSKLISNVITGSFDALFSLHFFNKSLADLSLDTSIEFSEVISDIIITFLDL
jgi:hypothetical protein